MTVEILEKIPIGVRRVPVLTEPSVGHYPEFRNFLIRVFDLEKNFLKAPCALKVNHNFYEFIFIGRSGEEFPAALEINALPPGLEPLDENRTDRDLWDILEWLIEGVGPPWSLEALRETGSIYRVNPLKD